MRELSRRHFVTLAGVGTAALAGGLFVPHPARAARPFVQPPLPFDETALAPVISADTVRVHYGKHHAGYFTQLNALSENTAYADLGLEQVIIDAAAKDDQKIFNNAAQAFNHSFYWDTLKPGHGKPPAGALAQAIDRDFGDFTAFKTAYLKHATGLFGSGWVWLVVKEGKLVLEDGANADTPLIRGHQPLAVIDVWEHAYYLDYQNRRADHVQAVLDRLINWDVVGERFTA